ncbi:MAG: LacI family transcriptional regulator [Defluviitaleaceae bacterium]|nr:LacI family transcriptional regulator [Defluviitaleaceae bacterium]
MITIRDVATIAGVSVSTVSRVLNNSGYVSPQSRGKVELVIQRTGFAPSAAAVELSRRESSAIGVVVPEVDNRFFGEVLRGISEICDESDLSMITCDTANSIKREDRALRMLASQRVRGLIFTPAAERGSAQSKKLLEDQLNRLNVPVVVLDRHVDSAAYSGVYYENVQSGYLAAKQLLDAGHTRLGIITGDLRLRLARERLAGYVAAVDEAGLAADERFVLYGDFTVETAYKLAREMYSSGRWPQGIVTCNNLTSLGFLKATLELGKQVGRDIAVVGIDHVYTLDILGYNFSCVTRDTHEMGRAAVRLISRLIENKSSAPVTVSIPCTVSLRGSELLHRP